MFGLDKMLFCLKELQLALVVFWGQVSSLKTSNERLNFLTKYFVGNVNRLFIA